MNNIIKRTWNQNRMVNIEDLRGMAFQAEDGGHTFEISGINDANETVSLSGTVAGVFMRPDGTDVALTGTASDGVVSVTLSDACYAVDGRFGFYIFVTSDSKKTCVYACIGTVAQTSYGTVAGDTPQDVVDLINAINAAIASIPADYSDLLDAIAATYSDQSVYPIGAYRWYDGILYKSKVAITTAESFTAAHWETVALADDVSALMNAINLIQNYDWQDGYINKTGTITTPGVNRRYSGLLICKPDESITYVAEKHNNICGISFYDENGQFISGVTYTGETAENTTTSPENAAYFRLSTTVTLIPSTYAKLGTNGLKVLNNKIASVTERLKRNIPFVTNGTNRSTSYYDISDMVYAEVVDQSYDIVLYYGSEEWRNSGWIKKVNILNYPNPKYLQLRKSDNSVMPAGSATNVAVCERTTDIVTRGELNNDDVAVYVDGVNGNDDNSGTDMSTAFATIQKAIDSGYKTIIVRSGTYTSPISMSWLKGVHISCYKYSDQFNPSTSPNNTKVIIDCGSTIENGVSMTGCVDCSLTDIEVKNATGSGYKMRGCVGLYCYNCISHDIPNGQGFELVNTNGTFESCGVYNIGTMGGGQHHDGFNIHGTGTTEFINCWGHTCEDDGISHHDACEGLIDGGEWYGCGKGGVASPTHGSRINIVNVYSHDNAYGLYAENEYADLVRTANVSNCAFKDNTTHDITSMNNTLNIWNCVYDTISHRGGGSNNIIQ